MQVKRPRWGPGVAPSGDGDQAAELADRATAILDRIRVRPPRSYVAGQDAYVGVAQVRLAPIVQACRDCGWSDGVVEGSLVLAEVVLRRGDAAAAVEAAGSAVAEALRTGLPTAWRAHRAMAEACRAAGDEEGAASHAAEADRAVARVRDRIHDRSIREAFESAVAGGPFREGDGRWR